MSTARVLVVEDDADIARYTVHVLTRRGHFDVVHTEEPVQALAMLAAQRFDLLLTDLRLPAMDGISLARSAQTLRPDMPAIVMTAHASLDVAVDVLRGGIVDLLQKPVEPAQLLEQCQRAIAASRAQVRREVVLAVGAHPDDVEIGVGGTLLAHHRQGDEVFVATLTQGAAGGDVAVRRRESEAAAEVLGAGLHLYDLVDTEVSDGAPTVGILEHLIGQIRPTIVYTHTVHDLHQDHRATHRATLVAARRVPRLYCFESPSSTVEFQPTRFVGVDALLDRKLEAISVYRSQTEKCTYLAPDLLRSTARYWGRHSDSHYAEPFEVIKERAPLGATSEEAHHEAA